MTLTALVASSSANHIQLHTIMHSETGTFLFSDEVTPLTNFPGWAHLHRTDNLDVRSTSNLVFAVDHSVFPDQMCGTVSQKSIDVFQWPPLSTVISRQNCFIDPNNYNMLIVCAVFIFLLVYINFYSILLHSFPLFGSHFVIVKHLLPEGLHKCMLTD